MQQTYKFVTADEAASYVNNGDIIGFSGFTPAGCPKEVPTAIAKRAEAFHAEGKEFKVGMYTGASTGDSLDVLWPVPMLFYFALLINRIKI